MKLNNKGFTLIEILAVMVILGILIAFMYPNVTKMIAKNREDNVIKIKESIRNAAKIYISDHRYEISVDLDTNLITKIDDIITSDGKILVSYLEKEGDIKTDADCNIYNPQDKSKCLDKDNSYIVVTYNSSKKDFNYDNEPILVWTTSCN